MTLQKVFKAENYKSVLEYNQQNSEQIARFCAPLMDCFGIASFGYFIAFDDGRYLLLSNDQLLIETLTKHDLFYRTDHFKTLLSRFCRYAPVKANWPDLGADTSIKILKERGCNFTGYNIVRELEGGLEGALFSHNAFDDRMRGFYQNHEMVMDEFVTKFRTIGHQLCDAKDASKLGISENLRLLYPKIDSIFMNSTPWERQVESFNNQIDALILEEIHSTARAHHITHRELECLSYFTSNLTAKEIARRINISHRTVEQHLSNIRFKTGLQSKNELTQWFEEKFNCVLKRL